MAKKARKQSVGVDPSVDPSVETAPSRVVRAFDDNKVLMAMADGLIAEVARMRADTIPADVQAAVRSLRKWRA
tara:strand:+ start:6377 stop:6595 length:219 start_codon:yes stop_codon:yes gene_type:complete